jgi:predicted dienelactone hydrolase
MTNARARRTPVRFAALALTAALAVSQGVIAQNNRIDVVTPSAPDLATFGVLPIGVRTFQATDRNRPDVLAAKAGAPTPRYDRTLTVETWYPSVANPVATSADAYRTITRDPSVVVSLHGRAVRDAAPDTARGPFPLIVISHGYPGNRFLLAHLAENLASKGFVVASIDHKDSTYDDQKTFASTLYNRPFDQLFVVDEMARLGVAGTGSFLSGLVDASRTGIVGYSMGGYGVVNVMGGGFSTASEAFAASPPNRLLAERGASNPAYRASVDARVRAAIAIGPWGMQTGFWDREGLAGVRGPILFVAGSVDEVSGYEKGTRALYEGSINATRYLLTFVNAGHNAGAPIPAPAETYAFSETLKLYPFAHYADPVWDTTRMNNILAHFATAFFDVYVKGDAEKASYLDVVPNGRDAVYAVDRDGKPTPTHTYWKGFKRGTAVGLLFEQAKPSANP